MGLRCHACRPLLEGRRMGGKDGLIIKESPNYKKRKTGDWRRTGGKDGNTTVEARRGNAKTSCQ